MFESFFGKGYDQRRVLEEAIEKLNTKKGWAILAGSTAAMYILQQKGVINMGSYEQRRILEKIIDKVSDEL